MADFGELTGPLFEPVVKAIQKSFMPEGFAEKQAAKAAGVAAGEVAPKLSDYALGRAPAPAPAARIRVPMPEPQPFEPTTRVNQMAPEHAELGAKAEVAPAYLEHLDRLGGGRVITNDETIAKALNGAPMTEDELANWHAEKKVNTVDVTRAHLLWTDLWDQYFKAIQGGDDALATDLENRINKLDAGYNNATATPGRALQIQAIFQEADAKQNKIRQLRAAGLPYDVIRAEMDSETADMWDRHKDVKDPAIRTLLQKIEDYATAAKLSSPVTWENKGLTDGLTYAYRGVEQHIRAVAAEMGGRPEEAEALRSYAFGTGQGFKDGWRKFLDSFNPHAMPSGDLLDRPMGRAGYAISFPFRVLSGVTNLWHSVIYDSEVNTRAHMAAAKMPGMADNPAMLAEAIRQIRQNLPEDWHKDAMRVANEYTFQEDPDRFLRFLQKGQRVPGMRFFLPVIKIPYNITRFAVRRSPLGFMSGENIRLMRGNAQQKALATARLGLGVALFGVASAMAAHGDFNGALPQDPRERALWEAEGRQPFSIRVATGDKAHYFKYNKLGPFGTMLSMVAAVHEALRNNDMDAAQQAETTAMMHIDGVVKRMLYQTGHGALDMPFLEDFQSLLDAIMDPHRHFEGLKRSVATGFLPNFLRDIKLQIDPEMRKPQSVAEALEYMIPGLSGQLLPKTTVLNTPIEAEQNRLLRAFKTVTPSLEDQNTQFLRAIRWAPLQPPTTLRDTRSGKSVKLTGDTLRGYMAEMGEVTLAAVQSCMTDPNVPPDPADARKFVSRVVEQARRQVTKKYMALAGLKGDEAQQEAQRMQEGPQ